MRPAGGAAPATDFLYVGRLVPEKKPALLVAAFAAAAGRLPEDRRLVLVGAGPEEARLRALAGEAGLGDRVVLAGHVGDQERLRALYAAAIASVSPGYVGLSITQSLGFGVPMIHADDEPHSPEVEAAVAGFNAVPFRSDSVAALADALVAVSGERDAWAARRQAIADDCAARYSLEAMADALLAAARGCQLAARVHPEREALVRLEDLRGGELLAGEAQARARRGRRRVRGRRGRRAARRRAPARRRAARRCRPAPGRSPAPSRCRARSRPRPAGPRRSTR